eukprot:4555227-Lingulodinium_polyedra.AAC.1
MLAGRAAHHEDQSLLRRVPEHGAERRRPFARQFPYGPGEAYARCGQAQSLKVPPLVFHRVR